MTDTYELPPMPEPDGSASVVVGKVPVGAMMGDLTEEVPAWSRKLVEDFARAAIQQERERAARLCEEMARAWIARGQSENWEFRAHGAEECASAIRAG
jgi:hypothetical protein